MHPYYYQPTIKILIVGSCGVGKTSIVNKLVYNTFSNEYKATLGVDFSFKNMQITTPEGKTIGVKIQLWDIAGQEKTSILTRSYYKDAQACLVVGDLTQENATLLQDIQSWSTDVKSKVKIPGSEKPIPCSLLLNKSDLPGAEKYDSLLDQIKPMGFLDVQKTSALTGENLESSITKIALEACKIAEKQQGTKDRTAMQINVAQDKNAGCC